MPDEYDAVVVGAGLSGLAVANALAKVGKRVKVIERDSAIEQKGASMGLSPTGTLCLRALGPEVYATAKACTKRDVCKGSTILTKEGNPTPANDTDMLDCMKMTQDYGPEDAKGFGICNWNMLRKALADALPAGALELGREHTGYKEDAGGVTLYFRGRAPLRAKLLLGADGAASEVRRQCLGEAGAGLPPRARVCWHGVSSAEGGVKPGDNLTGSFLWVDGGRYGGVIRVPGPGGATETHWMFNTCVSKETDAALTALGRDPSPDAAARRLQLALDHMQDFDPDFLRVVASTDPRRFDTTCLYNRAPSQQWGRGRVTLLGDAAHLVSPMYGTGPAMALEDAVALASSVQQHGAQPAALRRYEARRSHRVTRIQVAMATACQCKFTAAKDGRMTPEKARVLKFIFDYQPEELLEPQQQQQQPQQQQQRAGGTKLPRSVAESSDHSDSSEGTGYEDSPKRDRTGMPPLPPVKRCCKRACGRSAEPRQSST